MLAAAKMFIQFGPVFYMQSLIEQIGVDDFPVEGKETTCFLGIPGDLVASLWLEGFALNLRAKLPLAPSNSSSARPLALPNK